MRTELKSLALVVCFSLASVAQGQPADVTDPGGNVWTVGTWGWYYWSGFFVGLTFFGFAFVKRLAQRAAGSHTDY